MDFGSFSLHHFPPFLQRKGTDPGRVIQELDHFFAVHADSEIGDGQCPYHCKNALFVASPESRGHCQRGFCYNLLDCFRVFHYVDIRVEADIEISILENFKDLFHSLICLGRNNGVPPQCYENKSSFSNKNIFFCGMTTKNIFLLVLIWRRSAWKRQTFSIGTATERHGWHFVRRRSRTSEQTFSKNHADRSHFGARRNELSPEEVVRLD